MDEQIKMEAFKSLEAGHYYIIKLSRPINPPQHNGVSLGVFMQLVSFLYIDCKHVTYRIVSEDDVWNPKHDSVFLSGLILKVQGDGSITDSGNFETVEFDEFVDVIEIDKEAFDDACHKYYSRYNRLEQLIEDVRKQVEEDPQYKLDHYMLMADWRNFNSVSVQPQQV